MQCEMCHRSLGKRVRVGTRFCGDACRGRAYRERERQENAEERTAAAPGVRQAADTGPPRRQRPVRDGSAARRRPNTAPPFKRVRMRKQIRMQAPPGAIGYRVVLPSRTSEEPPHVLPQSGAPGAKSFWQLDPFEPPDDLRLQDGRLYRLLHVDAQGAVLPPRTADLPALRFFLGPPDAPETHERADISEFTEFLRQVQDPRVRAECARDFTKLKAMREEAREVAKAQARSKKQFDDVERRTAAAGQRTQEMLERMRKQAAEEAEKARAQAHAAAYARQSWLIPLIIAGVPSLFALGAWLWPLLKQRFAALSAMPGDERAQLAEGLGQRVQSILAAAQAQAQAPQQRREQAAAGAGVTAQAQGVAGLSSAAAVAPAAPAAAAPAAPAQPASAVPSEQACGGERSAEEPAGASMDRSTSGLQELTPERSGSQSTPSSPPARTQATETQRELPTEEPAEAAPKHAPPGHNLSAEDIMQIADLTYDLEKRAQLGHESALIWAQRRNEPAPVAPRTSLSDRDRKELRQLAADPQRMSAYLVLANELDALLRANPEAVTRLPAPFRSLRTEDTQRIRASLRDAARVRYFSYAVEHIVARLTGKPLPAEPATPLTGDERRQVRRLTQDQRMLLYASYLASSGVQANPVAWRGHI